MVRSRWNRLALALVAIPALLIGLLAMHVLDGATSKSPVHSATNVAMHSTSVMAMADQKGMPADVGSVASESCDNSCPPAHDMDAMACVLALLVTAVLLWIRPSAVRWHPLRLAKAAVIGHAGLAPPRPPSLYVLSVCRT